MRAIEIFDKIEIVTQLFRVVKHLCYLIMKLTSELHIVTR